MPITPDVQGPYKMSVAVTLLRLVQHKIRDQTRLVNLPIVEQLDQSHMIESKRRPSVYVFAA